MPGVGTVVLQRQAEAAAVLLPAEDEQRPRQPREPRLSSQRRGLLALAPQSRRFLDGLLQWQERQWVLLQAPADRVALPLLLRRMHAHTQVGEGMEDMPFGMPSGMESSRRRRRRVGKVW
jgi:hypothetical protein